MDFLTERKYSFKSRSLNIPDDTFAVVNFKGFESISKPYEFNIMLVSDNPEIDLSEVLKHPATFTIHREDGDDVEYHGILAQFEQLQQFNEYVFYQTLLVPKLWWLTLTHHNQVCLNNSVRDIIENTLKDGGLFSSDFEFKIQKEYPAIDYVCQYEESHFNFISRWAEREGIYYYFEQTENGEKIIFTDTKISHTDLFWEKTLYFSPPSGLDTLHRTENIKSFTCRQRQLPAKVLLKDYNYERPSLGISGTADVDENGRGTAYIYGEHFPTSEEGNRLAAIRAEELLCKKIQFFGESAVPFMEPGYTFTMEDHYRESFNNKYLIEEVTHEGSQTGYLIAGIRNALSEMEERVYYLNHFTAIPADVQYRPERTAQKPRISGTIHAKIDAEQSGETAELDEQGRYKVRLPFDINDNHKEGKASSFVRMMQPYAGRNYGVHFPLHKGTDVHLSFVNGDPDRPVISGAVPNPETYSPVTGSNQKQSVFRDDYGNELVFNTTPGDEHIRLHSPHHDSTLTLGRSFQAETGNDCLKYSGGNSLELAQGTKVEGYAGSALEVKGGLTSGFFFGLGAEVEVAGKLGILIGPDWGLHVGPKWDYHFGPTYEKSEHDCTSIADKNNIISAGKKINLIGGVESGSRGKVSILEGDDKNLILSFGENKSPTIKSKEHKTAKFVLYGLGILSGVIALVLATVSFILLIIQELKGKEKDSDGNYKPDVTLYKGILDATALPFSVLVVIAAVVAAIFIMIAGWLGSKDKHVPRSHWDADKEKPDALIELQKEGIFIGIQPEAEVRNRVPATATSPERPGTRKLNKDEKPLSKIVMNNKGKVDVYSNAAKDDDKQILLGIGKSGSETAKTTMKKEEIQLEVGDSILTVDKNKVEVKSGGSKITIKKDGDIRIESKQNVRVNKGIITDRKKTDIKSKALSHKNLKVNP